MILQETLSGSRTCESSTFPVRLVHACLCAILVLSVFGTEAGADGGWSISGLVVSSETGEPMPFANMVLTRLDGTADETGTPAGGTMTMPDGTYRLAAEPGLYRLLVSYIGYHHLTVSNITVDPGEKLTLNISLTPSAIQVAAVEVTAKALQNTDIAILSRQRRAAAVSDGISAEQIGRSTDSNAAEVLQRVTGLSMVGGRYVYVRGLGERYSSTQINGTTIGSPEPNKRVVPLDMFASGLLDNVVVQKTYTPDQPGEFAGGVVDVNTREFPGRRLWSLSLSSGYSAMSTGRDFFTYDGGSTDFLGIDDGTREMPRLVRQLASNARVAQRSYLDSLRGVPGGFSAREMTDMGRSFNKTWTRSRESAAPSYSFGGSYGNEILMLGRPLGFIGSLSFSNGFRSWDSVERFFKSDGGVLHAETDYDVETSEAGVLWGAIGNAGYRLNDFNTLSLRTMYNRSAEDEFRFYEGTNENTGKPLQNTRLRYIERGLFSGSVQNTTHLKHLNGGTLNLRFNYSRADRNEPDRREYNYELQTVTRYEYDEEEDEYMPIGTEDIWQLSTRTNSQGLTRMYGEMTEEERSPEVHLTVPFRQWNRLESRLKIGAVHKNKDRDASWRRFHFSTPSDWRGSDRDSVLALTPDILLQDEFIGAGNRSFRLVELTRPERDNYRASMVVTAGYAMLDLPVSRKVRAVVGARVEKAEMTVKSYDIFGLDLIAGMPASAYFDSTASRLSDTDILPAVNLTISTNEMTNVRLAYSMTVSRPDFRELSAFGVSDFVSGYEHIGNPNLKRAQIHNYDIRYESYVGHTEMYALSGFYKKMHDPIENSIRMANNPVYQPINGNGGYLWGAEIEGRLRLRRISAGLDGFSASGNMTLVKSESDLEKLAQAGASHKRPLEGQSPYVVNLGMHYVSSRGTTSLSAMYNIMGKRLAGIGLGELPDIYEKPASSLDMTFSRSLGWTRLKLSAENILNSGTEYTQEQKEIPGVVGKSKVVTRSYGKGRSFSLSLSIGA